MYAFVSLVTTTPFMFEQKQLPYIDMSSLQRDTLSISSCVVTRLNSKKCELDCRAFSQTIRIHSKTNIFNIINANRSCAAKFEKSLPRLQLIKMTHV